MGMLVTLVVCLCAGLTKKKYVCCVLSHCFFSLGKLTVLLFLVLLLSSLEKEAPPPFHLNSDTTTIKIIIIMDTFLAASRPVQTFK